MISDGGWAWGGGLRLGGLWGRPATMLGVARSRCDELVRMRGQKCCRTLLAPSLSGSFVPDASSRTAPYLPPQANGTQPAAAAASMAADALYSIRPSFAEKFRPQTVKTLIDTVLKERLADKTCVRHA